MGKKHVLFSLYLMDINFFQLWCTIFSQPVNLGFSLWRLRITKLWPLAHTGPLTAQLSKSKRHPHFPGAHCQISFMIFEDISFTGSDSMSPCIPTKVETKLFLRKSMIIKTGPYIWLTNKQKIETSVPLNIN